MIHNYEKHKWETRSSEKPLRKVQNGEGATVVSVKVSWGISGKAETTMAAALSFTWPLLSLNFNW